MPDEQEMLAGNATTSADINDALARAEALMSSAEASARTCRLLVTVEAAVIALAIVADGLLGTFTSGTGPGWLTVLFVTILLFGILVASILHLSLLLPLRRRVRRDARATMAIVDFLREVIPLVAERERWSQTRVRVADARIARFPIDAAAIR